MLKTNYSEIYRLKLDAALNEAKSMCFPNESTISPWSSVEQATFDALAKALQDFYPNLVSMTPPYWGNLCLPISSILYSYLSKNGFNVDLVIGEVNVNGTLEFDATVESIRHEYLSAIQEGPQALHVWLSAGDDIVIDAGLPDRMILRYNYPRAELPRILVGRAGKIAEAFNVRHQPLVVGTDFVAKTNPFDPRAMPGTFGL